MMKQVRMRLTDDDIKVVAILLAKKMKFQLEQARQKLEAVWDAEEKERRQIIEFRYEPVWVWGFGSYSEKVC